MTHVDGWQTRGEARFDPRTPPRRGRRRASPVSSRPLLNRLIHQPSLRGVEPGFSLPDVHEVRVGV